MKATYSCMNFFKVLGLSLVAWLITSSASAADPTTQPLLYSSDVEYLGSFKLPRPATGESSGSFDYGGMALAIGADGQSLYVGGHKYNQSLGRVVIPQTLGGTATLIQKPVSVPGSVGSSGANELSGAFVYHGRLIVQKRITYDNSGGGKTHAVGSLNISGFSSFSRMANINSAQFASGYMGPIPPEWQSLLGGPAFAGNSLMSIISLCSNGPSFFVFDPDDVGVKSPIPSTPLMYYPIDHPLADTTKANDLLSRADQYNAGIVFPPGTRSVLFFSRHGYGPHTYKQDDGCGGEQGEGAKPYRRQVTAFDANDLLAVKNGTKQPYEIRPYTWWELSGPQDSCGKFQASGLAYDPATNRIYAALYYGSNPQIHVWRVNAPIQGQLPAPYNLKIMIPNQQ